MFSITKLAYRYVDKHARAPRFTGFSADNGVADRGTRYGGAQTIHNTGTIDVRVENGKVIQVWFRCQELPFAVSYDGDFLNQQVGPDHALPLLVAVELQYNEGTV